MNREELIEKLKDMHNSGSTDPETLCGDTFHSFKLDHPDINRLSEYQAALFKICRANNEF